MRIRRQLGPVGVFAACLCAGACAAGASTLGQVAVQVPSHPGLHSPVTISFRARGSLAAGGYYYAVIVLERYPGYSQASPPPCAGSSDMALTDYGYPHTNHPVRLALLAARQPAPSWCPSGTYQGAVYAVPHRPPCSHAYPCYGKGTGYEPGPCWELGTGHAVCGTVPNPNPNPNPAPGPQAMTYSFPGGLPKPLDRHSRVVGHFKITF